jgi:alpha/beta superfamily hydrolase
MCYAPRVASSTPERLGIPSPAGSLDAEWRPGSRGGAIVAPPHPEYGGARSNPVVQTLVEALAATGRATLAFDWRGVGESEGRITGDVAAAVEDYTAAARALAERAPGPWIATGYSFGAATALRVAATDPAAAGLLLVAPPVAMTGADDLTATRLPVGIVVGEHDDIAPVAAIGRALTGHPDAQLEVVPGADHFFFGAGAAGLQAAIGAALATLG